MSQAELGARLGISQSEMSRRERGALESCSVAEAESWAQAVGAHLAVEIRVDGERPLIDARHAALQEWLVGFLRGHGWVVGAERSFNHFGDRGRIDVLGYHPPTRTLLVSEIKSRLEDTQDTTGRLDVKRRVAPTVAREEGWQVDSVVPCLILAEHRTSRRRVEAHPALFGQFSARGRGAIAWLRQPRPPPPAGVLAFVGATTRDRPGGAGRVGRRRRECSPSPARPPATGPGRSAA